MRKYGDGRDWYRAVEDWHGKAGASIDPWMQRQAQSWSIGVSGTPSTSGNQGKCASASKPFGVCGPQCFEPDTLCCKGVNRGDTWKPLRGCGKTNCQVCKCMEDKDIEMGKKDKAVKTTAEDVINEVIDNYIDLKADLEHLKEQLSELKADLDYKMVAWCQTHQTYEPGVPYDAESAGATRHHEPDYMEEDLHRSEKQCPVRSLPIAKNLMSWLSSPKSKNENAGASAFWDGSSWK